jgi:hypothetical protein
VREARHASFIASIAAVTYDPARYCAARSRGVPINVGAVRTSIGASTGASTSPRSSRIKVSFAGVSSIGSSSAVASLPRSPSLLLIFLRSVTGAVFAAEYQPAGRRSAFFRPDRSGDSSTASNQSSPSSPSLTRYSAPP